MNKKPFLWTIAALSLVLFSACSPTIYSGYEKMENGAYLKFYEKGDSDLSPRIGDGVTIEMAQYFNDSLLFTTAEEGPLELILEESSFVGDVPDAILMMHIGDSARLVVLADSVFAKVMMIEPPVEYAGKPLYYELKLLAIKLGEEIEAERRAILDSLSTVENDYLIALQEDKKNTVTESGLIVMEKTGKGKVAQLGDYLDFHFMMCTKGGDTLMNSFADDESVEIQYVEEFICKGLNEALGMVPQGGTMRFVIPSQLAFDSMGYRGLVLPYEPLIVNLKMNEIMDKASYEKKQAAKAAERQAEKERLKTLETKAIQDYIKANNIDATPTETGIYIIPQKEGEGNLALWGDQVAVHYVLSNLKGDVVESSYDYEQPIEFKLGNSEMIPAIEEALMTMAPGAKVTVITPSEWAFGEIVIDEDLLPAYSPMKIDLELVEIK